MKEKYTKPEIEVIRFDNSEDIITCSNWPDSPVGPTGPGPHGPQPPAPPGPHGPGHGPGPGGRP